MEHSQKALLPPLSSLQLSSLLTMKGGNLSQLNDCAMSHPACGECKHCEMQEKGQANSTYQSFSAQVTKIQVSLGG